MAEEFDALKRSRARAYLESVRAERVKVDALRDELAFERESMEPKGIRFDKLGGCSSAYADAIPDGVSRLEAMGWRDIRERERGYIEASSRRAKPYPLRGRRKARPCSCAATFSTNRGARSPPTSGCSSPHRDEAPRRSPSRRVRIDAARVAHSPPSRRVIRFLSHFGGFCHILAAFVTTCHIADMDTY